VCWLRLSAGKKTGVQKATPFTATPRPTKEKGRKGTTRKKVRAEEKRARRGSVFTGAKPGSAKVMADPEGVRKRPTRLGTRERYWLIAGKSAGEKPSESFFPKQGKFVRPNKTPPPAPTQPKHQPPGLRNPPNHKGVFFCRGQTESRRAHGADKGRSKADGPGSVSQFEEPKKANIRELASSGLGTRRQDKETLEAIVKAG